LRRFTAGAEDAPDRRPLDGRRLQRAVWLGELAWRDLPATDEDDA